MKKLSIFLKSIILSIVSLCMVFGIAFNGIIESYRVNASSSSKVYSSDYYTLSYENNEVKLLLNADVSVYDNISKADLVELKDAIISVGYSAIFDDVDFGDLTSSLSAGSTGIPGGSVDISNVENIIYGQLSDYESIDNALAEDGTYDLLLEYYVDRYVDAYVSNNPSASVDEVLDSIEEQLTETIQTAVDQVYAGQEEYKPTNISSKVNSIVTDVKDNKDAGTQIELSLGDVSEIINIVSDKDVVVDIINELDVTNEIEDIIVNSSAEETVDFLKTADIDTVINVFQNVSIDKEDVKDMITNVGIDNLVDIVDTVGVDKIKELAQSVNLNKDDVNQIVQDTKSDLSVQSLLKAVKAIRFDGVAVYESNEVKMSGIKSLLKTLPKPADIANYTDDQMNHTWNFELETVFGSVEFDFTIGFQGNCARIRTLAQQIANTVDVKVENGVYYVDLYAPEKLDNLLLRASNSGILSDDIKLALFNLSSDTVEDVYGNITDKTLDEYLEILKDVDYKTIAANLYNAEKLNSVFNTTKFTDARLDAFVDEVCTLVSKASNLSYDRIKNFVSKYVDISRLDNTQVETLITKTTNVLKQIDALSIDSALIREFVDPNSQYTNENVYEYIDKIANYEGYYDLAMDYITKAYEAAPDRFKDNSVLDFYKGNGNFNYSGTIRVDLEKILNKISSNYGSTVYDALSAVLDYIPEQVEVNLSAHVKDVHRVTYNIGNEVKEGLLPVGADLQFYANVTELGGAPIQGWTDANGVEYTTMPAQDVELFPVIDFEVSINDGVSKVYDGVAYTLEVTTTIENNYTYQWYRNDLAIDGATLSTYDVVNVADSGSYYCEVSIPSATKKTATVEVKIAHAVIDIPELKWDYTNAFTYDETERTVQLTTALPNEVVVSYKDNVATNAGVYTAVATLSPINENYLLTQTSSQITWEIKPFVYDVSHLTWNYEKPFEWNGSAKEVKIVGAPDFVVFTYGGDGNKKIAAYAYHTTVTASSNNPNYIVVGEIAPLDWRILPKVVDVSKLTWNYTEPFVYDGTEKKVTLTSIPNGVKVEYINNVATAVGTYRAIAKTVPASNNYELNGVVADLTWVIKKAGMAETTLIWNYTEPFVYDGTEKVVEISNLPADVTATYTNNVATDAGTYTAVVTLESTNPNYQFGIESLELEWTILPAEINVSEAKWDYTAPFVYDEAEKTVSLVDVPENVVVTYTGNKATVVGTYTAKVELAPVSSNYVLVGEIADLQWAINKGVIDDSTLTWNYTKVFVYDGTEKVVEIANLPSTIKAVYLGNKATDAGTYTATATLTTVNENYDLTVTSLEIEWSIIPASIDVSEVKWNYTTPFTYDGTEKTVTLVDVPANVTVTYVGNTATNVGVYTAVAVVSPVSTNYEVVGEVAQLTWEIKKVDEPLPPEVEKQKELKFEVDGIVVVIIRAEHGVEASGIHYEEVTASLANIDFSVLCNEKEKAELLEAYDIALKNLAGVVATFEDNFTVSVYIPEEFRSIENLKLVHVAEDGTVTDMLGVVEGEYMVFKTTHFSNYAFVEVDTVSNWWIWVIVAVVVIVIIVVIVLLLRRRNKVEVTPITVEATQETSYLVVNENGVEVLPLEEAQENDILSEQETNEFAIGKIENGKIIIFKDGLPVKVSCGKVIEQEDGNTTVSLYKQGIKVVCKFENAVVEHETENNGKPAKYEIGQIEEKDGKIVVRIYKAPKVVE